MAEFLSFLQQLLNMIPVIPALHVFQAFVLLGAFLAALTAQASGGSRRTSFWLFVMFAAQVFVVVTEFIGWGPYRLIPFLSVYPLAAILLSLIWLGWIWSFPFPSSNRTVNALSIFWFVLLHLGVVALALWDTYGSMFGLPGTDWMAQYGAQVWLFGAAAVLAVWMFAALLHRPRGWFTGLVIGALLFIGLFAQKIVQPADIGFGGLFVLLQSVAYTLIPLLIVQQKEKRVSESSIPPAGDPAQLPFPATIDEPAPASGTTADPSLSLELARREVGEQLEALQSDNARLKALMNQGGYTAAMHLEDELEQSLSEITVLRQAQAETDNRILELERDARRASTDQTRLRSAVNDEASGLFTPLAGLFRSCEGLLETEGANQEEASRRKEEIRQRIEELRQKVERIQSISEPAPERISVSELALALATRHSAALEPRGLHWDMGIAEGLPNLYTLRSVLERALNQILTHAIHASPDGGTVGFHAQPADGAVRFLVTLNGSGYSLAELESIFVPAPLPADAHWDPASVRADLHRLGGNLLVDSVPGEKTIYTAVVPLEDPRSDQV